MKKWWLAIGGILAAGAVACAIFWFTNSPQNLRVAFLDVGQGDAIFIRTPTNEKILIDGGPAGNLLLPLGEQLSPFDRRIDLVVLTHPDADHVAGITDLLRRYKVGRILLTGVRHDSSWYDDILAQISEQKIPVMLADASMDFEFGDVKFDTIWPHENVVGAKPADANAASIVTKISFGEDSILLPGDLPSAEEIELVVSGEDLQAPILKLGHHGSKNSSSADFLAAVAPKICVVSAGAENNFGHPSSEVLDRAAAVDCEIVSTAEAGTLVFESAGAGWTKI